MTKRPYLSFIHEAGRNIGCEFTSIMQDWLYLVAFGNKSFPMQDLDLGINNSNSAKIIKSKSSTYEVLNFFNIPVVEHHMLLNPNNTYYDIEKGDSFQKAIDLFHQYNNKVVLKQDTGSVGKHVYLLDNMDDLKLHLQMLFDENLNVSIGPFYESEFEYRTVVLDGNPELIFAKERISSWKHNLSGGGAQVKEDIDTGKLKEIQKLAVIAAKTLNANFVSVDILETKDGFKVLEVNGIVSVSKYIQGNENRRNRALHLFEKAFQIKFNKL